MTRQSHALNRKTENNPDGRGWFGDSVGHARVAHIRWDDKGKGWFGDTSGHAKAAKLGWKERRSSDT